MDRNARGRAASLELVAASRARFEDGAAAEAVSFALQAVEVRGAGVGAYEHAARVLHDLKLYKASALVARGALDAGIEKPVIHVLLGKALGRLGRHDEGIEHLDAAIAMAPGNAGYAKLRDTALRRREQA